jgi:hypothetical protein
MKLIAALCIPFILSACCTNPPANPCADRPIYKPYKIEMPIRPKLESATMSALTDGLVVRSVENDFSKLIEYSQKLENILTTLPSDIAIKQ